ncbi:MAG: hypothetical protein M3Q34_01260 [bacterium]|nr:hypothetical protein [bacterium]
MGGEHFGKSKIDFKTLQREAEEGLALKETGVRASAPIPQSIRSMDYAVQETVARMNFLDLKREVEQRMKHREIEGTTATIQAAQNPIYNNIRITVPISETVARIDFAEMKREAEARLTEKRAEEQRSKYETKVNTELVSIVIGNQTMEVIANFLEDNETPSSHLAKIIKDITEVTPTETDTPEQIEKLKVDATKQINETIAALREEIRRIELEQGDATEQKLELAKVEEIAKVVGINIKENDISTAAHERGNIENEVKSRKKMSWKKAWEEAKSKVIKTTKLLMVAGALWVPPGGIDTQDDGSLTWNYTTLSERTFFWKNKGTQLAIPEMKKAVEIMEDKNLYFNTGEIMTPEATIRSLEITASGYMMPINRLTLASFSESTDTRCFGYMADGLVKAGIDRNEIVLYGDAWSYEKNMLDVGATQIYSIYDKHPNAPTKFNINKIKRYFEENSAKDSGDTECYTLETFVHGDIISMYNSKSHNFDQAFEGGKGRLHTHVGILVEEDGQKYVVHTVGENRRTDKLEDITAGQLQFKVVEIIRPDYGSLNEKPVELKEAVYDISEFINFTYNRGNVEALRSKTGYELLKGLSMNRDVIQTILNLTDQETNDILSSSVAVFGNESTFGDGEFYINEARSEKKVFSPIQIARHIGDILGVGDISRGIGQVAEENTFGLGQTKDSESLGEKNYERLFGGMDRYSVQYATSATPFILGSIYNHLKNICRTENIHLSRENMLNLTLCIYNKGWSDYEKPIEERLLQYKNGTFDMNKYTEFAYVRSANTTLRNTSFNFGKGRGGNMTAISKINPKGKTFTNKIKSNKSNLTAMNSSRNNPGRNS